MCEPGDRTMLEVTVAPEMAFEGVEVRKPTGTEDDGC